ncbi:PREDICTED: uncharacterized protein LOC108378595 [Rhagoletis zephyria]|uniref:uncharacterized protein LOC108378595 n=1 Tax=Rhagoletis zephyria TaxID=28612 RepID=UPI0008117752|nr:PREDICTED: uncharacterized protein LOC108378595 [Rhagoletis zephyria]
MQTYKKKLLKSNAFLTALYLDPRFNFCTSVMLTEEQKSKAEAFLKTAYKAMNSSRKSLSQITVEEPTEASLHAIKCEEEPTTSKKAYDKLTQRIMNLSSNIGESEEPQRSFMHKLIGLLSNKTMAPLDTDVLQYWKAMSFDAEVAEMLQAALSVPVTQVTVGRATSALVNLKEHDINYNLLLTKYNFHEINQPEVELEVPRELLQEMSFEK